MRLLIRIIVMYLAAVCAVNVGEMFWTKEDGAS